MSPSCSQNMPIYFPSGKYKLPICSFLEYCYTIVFLGVFLAQYFVHPSKGCLMQEKRAQNFFSPELGNNLYQAIHL